MKSYFFIFLLLLGACQGTKTVYGEMPRAERIAVLKENVHSKEQVLRILGSPAVIGHDGSFIYTKTVKNRVAFLPPATKERDVLQIRFGKNDKISKIVSVQNKTTLPYDKEETPAKKAPLSAWEFFLNNLGKYQPRPM